MKKPSFHCTIRLKPPHCDRIDDRCRAVDVAAAVRRLAAGAVGKDGVMHHDEEDHEHAQIVERRDPRGRLGARRRSDREGRRAASGVERNNSRLHERHTPSGRRTALERPPTQGCCRVPQNCHRRPTRLGCLRCRFHRPFRGIIPNPAPRRCWDDCRIGGTRDDLFPDLFRAGEQISHSLTPSSRPSARACRWSARASRTSGSCR